ncbi:MAG: hypothetical protein E7147_01690 [Rikenellaceae bacterium]|nr:hypothetical protein [Rikenellaceae bacterium]
MKVDVVKSLIVVLLVALIAYGLYAVSEYDTVRGWLTGVSAAVLAVTGVLTFGVSFEGERSSVMFKVLSGIMFFVFLFANLIFAFFEFGLPLYIILNGVLFLVYALTAVSIVRTKQ